MHEWMTDNALTPHLVVDATHAGVVVPEGHVKDGRIVLNVSYAATRHLVLGNSEVGFEARFGGVPSRVTIPVAAVLGIYARETGQGMVFGDEDSPQAPTPGSGGERGSRPSLKVVK
jgi:stringent starvation protein B